MRDDFDGIHRSVARHRLVAFKRDRNIAFFGLRTESVVVVDRTVRKDEYVARLPGYRGKILVGAVQPDIQAEPVARVTISRNLSFEDIILGKRCPLAVGRGGVVQPHPVAGRRKLTVYHLDRAAVILDGRVRCRRRRPVVRVQHRRIEIVAERGFLGAAASPTYPFGIDRNRLHKSSSDNKTVPIKPNLVLLCFIFSSL